MKLFEVRTKYIPVRTRLCPQKIADFLNRNFDPAGQNGDSVLYAVSAEYADELARKETGKNKKIALFLKRFSEHRSGIVDLVVD